MAAALRWHTTSIDTGVWLAISPVSGSIPCSSPTKDLDSLLLASLMQEAASSQSCLVRAFPSVTTADSLRFFRFSPELPTPTKSLLTIARLLSMHALHLRVKQYSP